VTEKEDRYVSELTEGATLCLVNSERLLNDAKILLYEKNSYLSCFLLTQLCLEELAKGLKLMEKEEKKELFSEKEWKEITKGKAHEKKLEYLEKVEDNQLNEYLAGTDWNRFSTENMKELEKKIIKSKQANSLEEYKRTQIRLLYQWRLDCVYVDYDFDKRQWIDPLAKIVEGSFIEMRVVCNADITRAESLTDTLKSKLKNR
jgi:AbiV family abortive infection protein